MAEAHGVDDRGLAERVARLEGDHARLVSVVNAHADLLRAIGALTEVLGVSDDGGASPDELGPGTPPGPPPVAAR